MRHTPIRNGHGEIVDLIDTRELIDAPVAAPAPASPAAPPRPPRSPSTGPTPLGSLRPQSAAQGQPAPGQGWIMLIAVVALIGLAVFALRGEGGAAPPLDVTAQVPSSPPAPTALVLVRAIVAYDAPNGGALGALEAGRAYSLVAISDAWQQIDIEGSGLVWVRSWELAGEPQPTATATPPPTATLVPYVPPAPVQQRPAYVPPPTPDWSSMPIVGRAESADGVLICESRISQADADRCLADLLAQTSTP